MTKPTEQKFKLSSRPKINPELAALNTAIIEAIQEVKGLEILKIDLTQFPEASADFFIICSATSSAHANGIVDRIERDVFIKTGTEPNHIEGKQSKTWMLVDYFSTVVHIFTEERRQNYRLEYLWGDAPATKH